MKPSLKSAILAKSIIMPNGCIEWIEGFDKGGIPIIKFEGEQIYPRTELFKDEHPEHTGKVFLNCPHHNPRCILPEHASSLKPALSIAEKLQDFIVTEKGCHFFTNHGDKNAYAKFSIRGKTMFAHTEIYKLKRGSIPKGKQIHHVCNEKRCFNVDHLKLVTPKQNIEYARRDGLLSGPKTSGEKHGNNKLNNAGVLEVIRQKSLGYSTTQIHNQWKISKSYISQIMRREKRADFKAVVRIVFDFVIHDSAMDPDTKAVSKKQYEEQLGAAYFVWDQNGMQMYFGDLEGFSWASSLKGYETFFTKISEILAKKYGDCYSGLNSNRLQSLYLFMFAQENPNLEFITHKIHALFERTQRILDLFDIREMMSKPIGSESEILGFPSLRPAMISA